jgi:hypothetical protein
MSDDPGFFVQFGINTRDLIAGFAGGAVNSLIFKRSDPTSIISSMVVGACTSNYLSEPIGHYLGTGAGPSGFIVGLASMAICQGIVEAAKTWRPFNANRTSQDANRNNP